MSVCRLSKEKSHALLLLLKCETGEAVGLKEKALAKDWHSLWITLEGMLGKDISFTEPDLVAVGNMEHGLQMANMFLLSVDRSCQVKEKPTEKDKERAVKAMKLRNELKEGLDGHCYGKIADIYNETAKEPWRFYGDNLRDAYDPGDDLPCTPLPELLEWLRGDFDATLKAGIVLGNFFEHSIPDFFSKTLPGWIEHDPVHYFKELEELFKEIPIPSIPNPIEGIRSVTSIFS